MSSNPSPTRSKVALRRARPTTAQGPRFGVVGSILFHGLIVAAAVFTFHNNFATPEDTHAVPVDLVTIADQTNVAAQAPPVPQEQPQPDKLDIPVPPREAPPEPDMVEAEPAPEMPIPKFDIAQEKLKPKPEPKVEPKETKKQQQADFDSLLNKLTAPDKSAKPVKNAKAGPRVIQAVGLGNAMTADIADALRAQIRRCWSLQIFPPNPNDAIVDYDLRLTRDGRVASLELLTRSGNSFTQAAAEAASRASTSASPTACPRTAIMSGPRSARCASIPARCWNNKTPLVFEPHTRRFHETIFHSLRPVAGVFRRPGRARRAARRDPGQCPAAAHRHSRFPARNARRRRRRRQYRGRHPRRPGALRPVPAAGPQGLCRAHRQYQHRAQLRRLARHHRPGPGDRAGDHAGRRRLRADFRLWDVFGESQMVGQQFFTQPENWRRVAHLISDAIYERITGEKGYFDTRIVFISESGPALKRVKRLAIMDEDGANPNFLTNGSYMVLTPRFNPTAQMIAYMSYISAKPRVYLFDLETGKQEMLGNFPNRTFSPRFSPDGNRVALTLETAGNSDIYVMDLRTRAIQRLTTDPAIDTAPSFSPDGRQITFESTVAAASRSM